MNTDIIPNNLRTYVSPLYWKIRSMWMSPYTSYSIDCFELKLHTSKPIECRSINTTINTERDFLEDFATRIRSSDVVYDIGSNVGIFACLSALCGADVTAFDPLPANAKRIQENMSLNKVEGKVVEAALSDNDGKSTFDVSEALVGADQGKLVKNGGIEVTTYRGETYIQENDQPTVLKMDVEGAEGAVLKGFGERLGECRLVYIERHHNKMDESPEKVIDLLHDCGFRVNTIVDRGHQDIIMGSK